MGFVALAPLAPTALAVSAAVVGLFSALSSSEKELITDVLIAGEDYLEDLYVEMTEGQPTYDLVEVQLPILEFVEENIRTVQGIGSIIRVMVDGHWYNV